MKIHKFKRKTLRHSVGGFFQLRYLKLYLQIIHCLVNRFDRYGCLPSGSSILRLTRALFFMPTTLKRVLIALVVFRFVR